jgi:predicted enzyme related to lactoylglutathione lyase
MGSVSAFTNARGSAATPGAEIPAGQLAPTELYFHCRDVPAAVERIERAGARVLSALARRAWGDDAAYFADPSGNVIVLARPGE